MAAESMCKGLFYIRPIFNSSQATDKQVDVSTITSKHSFERFSTFDYIYNNLGCPYSPTSGNTLSDAFQGNC
jgi:hypothetical protein